jgi:hypothetical protein
MTLDFSGIPAYSVIALVIVTALIDRFIAVRGRLQVNKVEHYRNNGGMIRFALHYSIASLPSWSEIRYSLVDKNNPTTVISGKTRGLDFSKKGLNAEFLLFKQDIVNEGEWELKIKVITMAGRLNPLYSLFPVQVFFTQTVGIVK